MLYKGIIFNSSCLWDSILSLDYLRKDVSVVHIVLDIECNYESLWDHGYLDYYILCSIHSIFEAKRFDFHAHVLKFDGTCSFIVVKSDVGLMTFSD